MSYDFDAPVERRGTNSLKWGQYDADVLPLWVADMDFRSPEPVVAALVERAREGVFGYESGFPELVEAVQQRLHERQGWRPAAEAFHFLPGLVAGLNLVAATVGQPGDGVAMATPIYPPFLSAVKKAGRVLNDAQMSYTLDGHILRYQLDFDALEAAVTPRTRLFMLCNPHNPVGRVYSRAELGQVAEFCLRHDLIICSDEIHCDLLLGDTPHVSIAALDPEIGRRTVTLLAPSKTYNLPGLGCSIMLCENPELLARLKATAEGIVPHPNIMAFTAAIAAYRYGQPWLDELLPYLRGNRDALVQFVSEHMPGVKTTCPEGTYLAWLNCRGLDLGEYETPYQFCLKEARVAFNDGAAFGRGGEGFVRVNMGTQRARLLEGLERMAAALASEGA